MRLSDATLAQVRAPVRTPAYDRAATRVGVVHFGPGAFHRAHQAWYFDRMLASDPGLAICAVSLRTPDLRDALTPQDGLYALAEKDAAPSVQVIGSIKEVLVASEAPDAVFERLMQARYVTATVTEKGYCLTTGGALDLGHPDIRHDLDAPERPVSVIGWITEALRRRKAATIQPFTTISCDNLSDNGFKLKRAVVRFATARGEPELAAWIEADAAFPCSMVDSITPATDDALRAQAAETLGLTDAWPVQRERFVQWVVEDRLGADASLFAAAGVTVATAVAPFERAKLRLLNGAHSTLAYVGLGLGHGTVAAAMDDPRLAGFVERMMREDVTPSLHAPDLDAPAYIDEILARFRNAAIVHKLSQIAWDGSQKLRFRLLETASEALAAGRPIDRLAVGVAAWMRFVVRQAKGGIPIVDPLAQVLSDTASACDGATADVARFLALEAVFPLDLARNARFKVAVSDAYARLNADPDGVLAR
ncbi:MAG: mannitol dehydrogenase family protein [Alphaproteobacteria bacterium]|nr:mannitol dehydrogenase family protein [Alphaproteobacteria bacterium]MBU1514819.1 mannitol dehydrogenase family protein [Alphaproteobacteria bacterium]MBU2093950.1 mannitol dehydrogenase family protein [Alphaproteobacteria bacterium]MBU2153377.1 mannitol dehydrogenase family protein [Alphaproteobacteria bacterium]MBU2309805.1 mannitol dehydrogenase family protein [Alphaproteobacteria bacterium]